MPRPEKNRKDTKETNGKLLLDILTEIDSESTKLTVHLKQSSFDVPSKFSFKQFDATCIQGAVRMSGALVISCAI